MNVYINDQKHAINDQSSLIDMIEYMEVNNNTGMAIAVNDTVIPKNAWETTLLNDGDRVLIINATSGG